MSYSESTSAYAKILMESHERRLRPPDDFIAEHIAQFAPGDENL